MWKYTYHKAAWKYNWRVSNWLLARKEGTVNEGKIPDFFFFFVKDVFIFSVKMTDCRLACPPCWHCGHMLYVIIFQLTQISGEVLMWGNDHLCRSFSFSLVCCEILDLSFSLIRTPWHAGIEWHFISESRKLVCSC